MKKTLIALFALAGMASAATTMIESGSYTINASDDWTTDNSTLYDYLNGAINEGGTLTFDLEVTYTGSNCEHYQCLLHVGAANTGMSIYANGGPNILVSEKHNTNSSEELTNITAFVEGTNNITVTITGKETPGTASVAVTINGVEYSQANGTAYISDLVWSDMDWSATESERNKYSVNCKAPGWNGANDQLADSNRLVSAIATYTAATSVPEPATASLSLLGLAALMMRRRRA